MNYIFMFLISLNKTKKHTPQLSLYFTKNTSHTRCVRTLSLLSGQRRRRNWTAGKSCSTTSTSSSYLSTPTSYFKTKYIFIFFMRNSLLAARSAQFHFTPFRFTPKNIFAKHRVFALLNPFTQFLLVFMSIVHSNRKTILQIIFIDIINKFFSCVWV